MAYIPLVHEEATVKGLVLVVAALWTLVSALVGGFFGDWRASSEYVEFATEIRQELVDIRNAVAQPNPIVIAKIEGLERRFDDFLQSQGSQ